MAVNEYYTSNILDHLSEFGDVKMKNMSGGIRFFMERIMFTIMGYDAFRWSVEAANQTKLLMVISGKKELW